MCTHTVQPSGVFRCSGPYREIVSKPAAPQEALEALIATGGGESGNRVTRASHPAMRMLAIAAGYIPRSGRQSPGW